MLKDIASRVDVRLLVESFYTKVKANELIGPIFTSMITTPELWEEHFETLTNFWEAILFDVPKYSGRPGATHIHVDTETNHVIRKVHFEKWLELFKATLQEHFEGPRAIKAWQRAEQLALTFHAKISYHQSLKGHNLRRE